MRTSLVLSALVAVTLGAVSVPSITFSEEDHSTKNIVLTSSAGSANVRFQILSLPSSVRGSPNEGQPAGSISAASGWKPLTVGATSWKSTSKQLYTDNDQKQYNAQALLVKDIFPNYGDVPGAWLSQHGENNWVLLEIPTLHDVSKVTIYETLNPGGVSEVELSSKQGNKQVVYQTNGRGASNAKQPSGANELTITFTPVAFDVDYIRIKVDASEMWRGIDYFSVSGLEKQETKLPGELSGPNLTFTPNGNKVFGCDEITYIGNSGDGWSLPGTLRFCYNGPRDGAGVLCSAHGTLRNAQCICTPSYEGLACQTPRCPMANGVMCNGVGNCNAGTCACAAGWTGAACERRAVMSSCSACNDPHYTSFYGSYFDSYGFQGSGWREGELLLSYSPGAAPHVLQVVHYAAHLFVDGVSIRYGDDIVTYMYRAGVMQVNCNNVGPGTYSFATGLTVTMGGWSYSATIPGILSMHMSSGCFSLTQLTTGVGQGLCFNNDIRLPLGACRLSQCSRCQTGELLAATEKISAKGATTSTSPPGKSVKLHPWTFYSKFTRDESETALALEDTVVSQAEAVRQHDRGVKLRGSSEKAKQGKRAKHSSPIQQYALSMVSVRETGKAPIVANKVPTVIAECPEALIRTAMSFKNCLKFLGTIMFDDCLMDACLLAAGDKKLTTEQAAAEAEKMNAVATQNRLEGKEERKELLAEDAEAVGIVKKEQA